MNAPNTHPPTRGLVRAGAALALAAAAALTSAPLAAAYDFSDVCKVVITLDYTAPSVSQHSFSITSAQQSDTQDATVSLQIQPGTFTLKTEGKLCGDLTNNAFTGTSLETTIDGTEDTDVAITVKALDTQAYAGLSQNKDYAPIIVSVSVSPGHHVKYGDDVTISVGAIDPIDGVDPGAYALTTPNGDTHGTFDTQSCGGGTSCDVTYTAAEGDDGNIAFSMEVTDAGSSGLTDTVSGYIRVDPSTGVDFQVANYHAPQLENMENLVPSNGQVAWEGTATFDVVVKDIDISRLSDAVTIAATAVVSQQLTEQHDSGMQTLACQVNDLAWSVPGAPYTDGSDDKHKFAVTWDPWTSQKATTTQADWGETWCEFTFTPTDSEGLVGSAVTFTLGAVGTSNSGGGFGQLPHFQYIFVSDYSPATGDDLTLFLTYTDPDSDVKLTVTPDVAFSSDGVQVIGAQPCTPCQEQVTINVASQGTHSVTLELEDATDPTLKHTKVLTFEAPARRFRRAEGNGDMGDMKFQISGGQLTTTVGGRMGDNAAPAGGGAGSSDGRVPGGEGGGNSGEGSGSGDGGFSSAAFGGAVVGTALVVAMVGVAVASKLNKNTPHGTAEASKGEGEQRRTSVVSIVFDDFSEPAQVGLSL